MNDNEYTSFIRLPLNLHFFFETNFSFTIVMTVLAENSQQLEHKSDSNRW